MSTQGLRMAPSHAERHFSQYSVNLRSRSFCGSAEARAQGFADVRVQEQLRSHEESEGSGGGACGVADGGRSASKRRDRLGPCSRARPSALPPPWPTGSVVSFVSYLLAEAVVEPPVGLKGGSYGEGRR